MRHLRFALLGIALLIPFGCSGDKSEEKSKTDKSTENAAGNSPKDQTPNPPNTQANNNTPSSKPPMNNTPPKMAAGGGSVLGLVPKNAALLVSVRPSALLGSPFFKALPIEHDELEQQMAPMRETVGFDAHGITSVSLAAWPGDGNLNDLLPLVMAGLGGGAGPPNEEFRDDFPEPKFREPEFKDDCNVQPGFDGPPPGGPGGGNPLADLPKFDGAIYLQFSQPIDVAQLKQKLPPLQSFQQSDFQGKSIWVNSEIPAAGGPAVYQPDSQTLVITLKNDLADIFSSTGQGLLATEAATSGANADFLLQFNLMPFQNAIKQGIQGLPPQAQLMAQMVTRFEGLSLFADANTGVDVSLNVHTADDQAPALVQGLVSSFVTDQQIDGLMSRADDLDEQSKGEAKKLLQTIKDSFKTEIKGKTYHASLRIPETAPATINKIQAEVEKRMVGKNNLKQIGIGLLNYHDFRNQFPFPSGEMNEDKLSWRVHILPFIDQQELYEQFKLDEPWDSETNKALLDKMPDVYKLSDQTKPGYTQFVAPAGKGFIIDGKQVRKIRDLIDGMSNTIVVLSVKPEKAIPWTKPGGFPLDPSKAAEILGGQENQFLALFGDGAVQKLDTTIDAKTLAALLTIAGGEPVDTFELFEGKGGLRR